MRVPRQGPVRPVHDNHIYPVDHTSAATLYVGLSVGAVVAEGILRQRHPQGRTALRTAFAEVSLTRMITGADISTFDCSGLRCPRFWFRERCW